MGVLIQLVGTHRKRESLNVFVCVILAGGGGGQNFGHVCMHTKRVNPRILLESSKSSLNTLILSKYLLRFVLLLMKRLSGLASLL